MAEEGTLAGGRTRVVTEEDVPELESHHLGPPVTTGVSRDTHDAKSGEDSEGEGEQDVSVVLQGLPTGCLSGTGGIITLQRGDRTILAG